MKILCHLILIIIISSIYTRTERVRWQYNSFIHINYIEWIIMLIIYLWVVLYWIPHGKIYVLHFRFRNMDLGPEIDLMTVYWYKSNIRFSLCLTLFSRQTFPTYSNTKFRWNKYSINLSIFDGWIVFLWILSVNIYLDMLMEYYYRRLFYSQLDVHVLSVILLCITICWFEWNDENSCWKHFNSKMYHKSNLIHSSKRNPLHE